MDTAAQWPPHQDIVVKGMEGTVSWGKERKVRPQKEEALNCPRCNSTNTKFCYYNNYSLTQPRYFCKTCRRYWTEGGSLRNIPVGGGSRKNKRSSSNLPKKLADLQSPKTQDLNLGFSIHHHHDLKAINEMIQVPNTPSPPPMELLTATRGFMPPGFPPSLHFSLDGLGSNYATFQGVPRSNGKLLFPFQELKQDASTHNSTGYWNGVIGGGGSW